MYASRKILLQHFDARAAEYRDEMASGDCEDHHQADLAQADKPVRIPLEFRILSSAPERSRTNQVAG